MAARFGAFAHTQEARLALHFLDEDFASPDHVGPRRRAEFLGDRDDAAYRADAYGVVRAFLERVRDSG